LYENTEETNLLIKLFSDSNMSFHYIFVWGMNTVEKINIVLGNAIQTKLKKKIFW